MLPAILSSELLLVLLNAQLTLTLALPFLLFLFAPFPLSPLCLWGFCAHPASFLKAGRLRRRTSWALMPLFRLFRHHLCLDYRTPNTSIANSLVVHFSGYCHRCIRNIYIQAMHDLLNARKEEGDLVHFGFNLEGLPP